VTLLGLEVRESRMTYVWELLESWPTMNEMAAKEFMLGKYAAQGHYTR